MGSISAKHCALSWAPFFCYTWGTELLSRACSIWLKYQSIWACSSWQQQAQNCSRMMRTIVMVRTIMMVRAMAIVNPFEPFTDEELCAVRWTCGLDVVFPEALQHMIRGLPKWCNGERSKLSPGQKTRAQASCFHASFPHVA